MPVGWRELEKKALEAMSAEAAAYIAGGAGLESTVATNLSAFEQYSLVPRMLRNVSIRDSSIDLLGHRLASPVLLAPVGVLELVHPQADVAVARAAAASDVPYILSNQASRPMEEVAATMGNATRWFQLYWSKSEALVKSLVQRAERCGCSAIVVTLDTTMLGWRTRDLQMAYLPFLEGKGIAQYTSDPVFQQLMDEPEPASPKNVNFHTLAGLIKLVKAYPGGNFFRKLASGRPLSAVQKFINLYSNPALTWDDLKFLRTCTSLPILLKGILHADDASMALQYGVDGIIVSNHGGRQVDGAIATLKALPGVVEKINGKIPVLLDGGVRGGADVFKALALGATAVCIGRPYAYGLAIAGEAGVREVIENLLADFELTMALAGCKNVEEVRTATLYS